MSDIFANLVCVISMPVHSRQIYVDGNGVCFNTHVNM